MKSQLIALMFYVILFGLVTILAIVDLFAEVQLVDIGLPVRTTNTIIVFLGLAGLVKSIIYLIIFEKHQK